MGSFSLWHLAILGILALLIYLALFIIKRIEKKEEKKLGFGYGFLCFILPIIGITIGIIKFKEPYGKNALLLSITGIILSIIGKLIDASNV